jgi:phospholipase/carboxylesterase
MSNTGRDEPTATAETASALLDCVEVETGADPVGSVIWMHGLGADAHDFEPIVPMLPLVAPLRFVFPNAPERPVTLNGGMPLRAWYDIDPRSPLSGSDDIRASADAIEALLEREVKRGIPAHRITLAGFSQGGVIALALGLRHPERIAGIMALSTYLHDHENFTNGVSFASIDVPIFMAHGVADAMIPITRAITSREALMRQGYRVEWHEYRMGHQVCPEQIRDIALWLNDRYG